jgi:hypothetical protein
MACLLVACVAAESPTNVHQIHGEKPTAQHAGMACLQATRAVTDADLVGDVMTLCVQVSGDRYANMSATSYHYYYKAKAAA